MITARAIGFLSNYLYRGTRRCLNNDHAVSTSTNLQNKNGKENHIVWLDMEMTGLEVETNHIMEVACFVTNEQLELTSDHLNIIIHQSDKVLENMSEWCKLQHGKSGLTNQCRLSKITLEEAQEKTLHFLENHVPQGVCPLAGNSIYMDRIFLKKYMPLVENYLHYTVIDISTIKTLARRWQRNIFDTAPKKQHCHRSVQDIKESLNELRYYKKNLFGS